MHRAKDSMRVLFITNIPSPYRVNFFDALSQRCNLTVLYERASASDRDNRWALKSVGNYQSHILPGIPISADGALCPGVIRFLKKDAYDIVAIGGYSTPTAMLAIIYLRRCGIPFLLNADGGFIRKNENIILYKYKHFFISKASHWLSSSVETNHYLMHYGANPMHTCVYPFTSLLQADILEAPPSEAEKQELQRKLGISAKTLILGVGQFIPRKGFKPFLETWIQHASPDMGLVLVGGGPEESGYTILSADHAHIRIVPFQEKATLSCYYRAANVLIMPTKEDIWGLVVNEALAAGLPVYSSDRCIAALTLAPSSGGSVRIFSSIQSLVEAIKDFPKNAESRQALGRAALNCIRPYTIESMVDAHMEFFSKVLERGE